MAPFSKKMGNSKFLNYPVEGGGSCLIGSFPQSFLYFSFEVSPHLGQLACALSDPSHAHDFLLQTTCSHSPS